MALLEAHYILHVSRISVNRVVYRRRIYLTHDFYLFSCALPSKVHPLIPLSNLISLSYVWLSYFFFRAHYYFFRIFFPLSSLFFPLDHSYLPTSLLNCISFTLRYKSGYIFKFPAQCCHLCKYCRTTYFKRRGVWRKKTYTVCNIHSNLRTTIGKFMWTLFWFKRSLK